jgi:hypothetical protein
MNRPDSNIKWMRFYIECGATDGQAVYTEHIFSAQEERVDPIRDGISDFQLVKLSSHSTTATRELRRRQSRSSPSGKYRFAAETQRMETEACKF